MRLPLFALLAAASLAVTPAHAYTLTGSHWSTSTITMQLQLGSNSIALTDGSTSWNAAAEDALSVWNSNIGATRFTVVRNSTAAIAQGNRLNNVFFSSDVYGQAWGSGVLAVTLTFSSSGSQSVECDVLFNSTLSWDSYRGAQRYGTNGTVFDFHRVAMHEFGHVLGLDHPDQAGQTVTALMNSRISNLDTVSADDVAGAQFLYGPNGSVTTAPQITGQPASQTVAAGSSVAFSVTASSTGAISYQWYKNGAALGGATASTLSLASVPTSAAGNYYAVVSNSAGSATSATATLTVTSPVPTVTPPSISAQPGSVTASVGSRATFSVSAAGTSPFTYAWRKNGATISGATQASYTIASVQIADAANYSVVVANSAGSATSNAATLTVTSAPAITTQPASQSANLGSAVTFTIAATGNPTPTYQWSKDGTAISGATSSTYSIASVRATDAGAYSARVANAYGTALSAAATLTVTTAPTISTAPTTQNVSAGGQITLSVVASGTPAPTYQWQKNGMNIAGATQSTYSIPNASGTDSGTYDVVVANSGGSVTTVPVLVTVASSQLVNLSTRGYVPPGGALTAGFVLRGSSDKAVLVRGIGPALNTYGVSNALADPQVAVIAQESAQTVASNDGWSSAPQLSTAFQSVGAFPLPLGSADSASEVRLLPGGYTTRVTDSTGIGGVALAEVYDAEASSPRARLINLSTLGYTGAGDNSLVAGFTVQGTAPKRVLIRAVGPGLLPYGVAGVVANPRLDVFPLGQSTAVASNDDWVGSPELRAAFTAAGAFDLADNSRDAATVLSLAPGGYTVVVSGANGSSGYVLVEIYDLDP